MLIAIVYIVAASGWQPGDVDCGLCTDIIICHGLYCSLVGFFGFEGLRKLLSYPEAAPFNAIEVGITTITTTTIIILIIIIMRYYAVMLAEAVSVRFNCLRLYFLLFSSAQRGNIAESIAFMYGACTAET